MTKMLLTTKDLIHFLSLLGCHAKHMIAIPKSSPLVLGSDGRTHGPGDTR
jgi:hypothetical protein